MLSNIIVVISLKHDICHLYLHLIFISFCLAKNVEIMKNIILICLLYFVSAGLSAQEYSSLEAIGELSDGLIAIKKADKWGFTDVNNNLVIDYRTGIASEHYNNKAKPEAPVFKDGLCMIKTLEKGIPYYGFIDKTGEITIPPKFLNVTNFSGDYALAILADKNIKGKNEYLNKDIIAYSFYEAVIDRKGTVIKDLRSVPHILMSKQKYKKPFSSSHFVSPRQVAVEVGKGEWQLISIDQNQ
jgi:hypothetical protein